LLKPIFKALSDFFNEKDIHFYVIGATARDIIMQLHNEKSGRATHDLDIAIAVDNWDRYKEIEEGILSLDGFTKDSHQQQRFLYLEQFQLDLVPFGEVMKQDDKIFWPPDESVAMSVLGFNEVATTTHTVAIDEETSIQIASLAGIFLLKLVAWSERNIETKKDADDIGFIIRNYYSINEDRIVKDHNDLYEDDFDTNTAGARLIGRDLKEILMNEISKEKILSILIKEKEGEEESVLVNQILETHKYYKYELIQKCIDNIIQELNEK
jgi:predicted nucleotidyltransferase